MEPKKRTKAAAAKSAAAAAIAVAKRPRGRPKREPANDDATSLSREVIIAKAAALTQSEPLTEISMVRLARDFGVAPGLIHYYVGSRDELVSGVLNLYFRDRVARMRPPSDDWREDLREIARTTMATMLQYRGVAAYISSHNRYRLFQKVLPGETDYGLEFFNIFAETLRRGGLAARTAALGYHLVMQYLVSSSMIEIGRQMPGEHRSFIRQRLAGLDPARYSGALYIATDFSQLNFAESFETGLEFLIAGIEKLDRAPSAVR